MNDVSIKHPEWLYIDVNGETSHGYDQEWFADEWQRLSGCGPTSASQVLSYSLFRDGLLDLETTSDQTLALERMNLVWKYVKPRFGGGVYKTQWMERGLTRLLEDKGLSYDVHMLNVSPFCASRVEVETAAQFIHDALAQDVPVAFLIRQREITNFTFIKDATADIIAVHIHLLNRNPMPGIESLLFSFMTI